MLGACLHDDMNGVGCRGIWGYFWSIEVMLTLAAEVAGNPNLE